VPLEQRLTLQGAKVLIVGAGGAARAAAFGLKNKGAEVFITNRTPEHAQTLARQSKSKYMKRADVAKSSFDVIINATPVGMGSSKQSPLEDKELNTRYLFDLVYIPAETKLIKMARAKNIPVISGLEMFVQQGARQFEIWTGKPAPIAEMSFVVSKALERIAGPNGNGATPPTAAPEVEEGVETPPVHPVRKASAPGKKKAKTHASKSAKKAARKTVKR